MFVIFQTIFNSNKSIHSQILQHKNTSEQSVLTTTNGCHGLWGNTTITANSSEFFKEDLERIDKKMIELKRKFVENSNEELPSSLLKDILLTRLLMSDELSFFQYRKIRKGFLQKKKKHDFDLISFLFETFGCKQNIKVKCNDYFEILLAIENDDDFSFNVNPKSLASTNY